MMGAQLWPHFAITLLLFFNGFLLIVAYPEMKIADTLAKESSKQYQHDKTITYKEAKTTTKTTQRKLWLTKHPHFNKADPYHQLQRSHQIIIFRLSTGHNRLNTHLHTKLGIGASDQCPCLSAAMTADHNYPSDLLQSQPSEVSNLA